MSYSIYVECKNKKEEREVLYQILKGFNSDLLTETPYIGNDLPYVNDKVKYHVGFNLNAGSTYLRKLCFLCLVFIAKKRNLKVYWDDELMEIKDLYYISSMEEYISRDYFSIPLTFSKVEIFRNLFEIILHRLQIFLEKKSIGKRILKNCNIILNNFK